MPLFAPQSRRAWAMESTTLLSRGFSYRRVRGAAFCMYLPSI